MPIIDPRVDDLIATLNEAELGWLGLEILNHLGREPDPAPNGEMLDRIPEALRAALDLHEPVPASGDAQVALAASYAINRLTLTLSSLAASFDALQKLGTWGSLSSDVQFTVADRDAEEVVVISQENLRDAMGALHDLRAGLQEWAGIADEGGSQ